MRWLLVSAAEEDLTTGQMSARRHFDVSNLPVIDDITELLLRIVGPFRIRRRTCRTYLAGIDFRSSPRSIATAIAISRSQVHY
jgi:hypothetical protein